MGKRTPNRQAKQNNERHPDAQWHPRGRLLLGISGLTIAFIIGAVVLLLSDSPALATSVSVLATVVPVLLELLGLNQPLIPFSHHMGKSRAGLFAVIVLLALSIGLWAVPVRRYLNQPDCGILGCKPPTVAIRLAFGEWKILQNDALPSDEILLTDIQTVLKQKLGCVGGLQAIDPFTDDILPELDLLITGTLQQRPEFVLTAQLMNPTVRQSLQPVEVRRRLERGGVQDELTILALQNELFDKILRGVDRHFDPATIGFVERIPTDNPDALRLNNAAVEAAAQKNYVKAVELLQEAIALDAQYADAYNNLGYALRQSGDLTAAIAAYNDAVNSLPCVPLYHYNLAFAYEEDQQYDRAIAAYKAALARNPAYTKALNNLGYVYLQQGDLTASAQYLDQGLTIDPDDAPLHKNRGRVYLAQGNFDDAIVQLKQATALFPDYAEAYFFLAEAYAQANQSQAACTALAAYEPLAAADAKDDPVRPPAAAMRSRMLNCEP